MKLLIFLIALCLISCKREISSPKELVYFHIYVNGDPSLASVTLDKPAESNFFATFDWFDADMQPHVETLTLKTGETSGCDATGIHTGYIRGIKMIDWTRESDRYIYVLDTR